AHFSSYSAFPAFASPCCANAGVPKPTRKSAEKMTTERRLAQMTGPPARPCDAGTLTRKNTGTTDGRTRPTRRVQMRGAEGVDGRGVRRVRRRPSRPRQRSRWALIVGRHILVGRFPSTRLLPRRRIQVHDHLP